MFNSLKYLSIWGAPLAHWVEHIPQRLSPFRSSPSSSPAWGPLLQAIPSLAHTSSLSLTISKMQKKKIVIIKKTQYFDICVFWLVCACVCVYVCILLIALQEGQTWSPPDNKCEHYTCINSGETLTTLKSHIICPAFQESNCHPVSITFSILINLDWLSVRTQVKTKFVFSSVGHNSDCSKWLLYNL